MSRVSLSIVDDLAHVRLTSAATGNVLDLPTIRSLSAVFCELRPDAVRAVLISAEGRNFCVGGDLGGMAAAEDRGALLAEMAEDLHWGLRALDALGVPVVTAVNGVAAGAGLSLAIAGDIVVAGESSAWLMAYTAIGLSADGGSSYRLPRLVGLRLAQDMAFLNRRLDAGEALAAGLVTRVVPDEALLDEATKLARQIAQGPTGAFRAMKRLFAASYASDFDGQLDAEAQAIAACAAGHDGGEGVRAFLDKRRPAFRGD